MNHKIVMASDLRAIGVPLNANYKTTVTIGNSYYNGDQMVKFVGVEKVPAIAGLGGVFLNLRGKDLLLQSATGEKSVVPACGFMPEYHYAYEAELGPKACEEHGMMIIPTTFSLEFRFPKTVPIIVSRGLLPRFARHPNTYCTRFKFLCTKDEGTYVVSYLLKSA